MSEAASSGRVMAVDPGRRRIGVAISDETGLLAHPVATIHVRGADQALEELLALVREHRPVEIVVGLPLNMDGTRGPEAERAERFARRLEAASGLAVSLHDERLTTAWAERTLIERDLSRAKRRKVVDRLAAVILLQGWLDRRRAGP